MMPRVAKGSSGCRRRTSRSEEIATTILQESPSWIGRRIERAPFARLCAARALLSALLEHAEQPRPRRDVQRFHAARPRSSRATDRVAPRLRHAGAFIAEDPRQFRAQVAVVDRFGAVRIRGGQPAPRGARSTVCASTSSWICSRKCAPMPERNTFRRPRATTVPGAQNTC